MTCLGLACEVNAITYSSWNFYTSSNISSLLLPLRVPSSATGFELSATAGGANGDLGYYQQSYMGSTTGYDFGGGGGGSGASIFIHRYPADPRAVILGDYNITSGTTGTGKSFGLQLYGGGTLDTGSYNGATVLFSVELQGGQNPYWYPVYSGGTLSYVCSRGGSGGIFAQYDATCPCDGSLNAGDDVGYFPPSANAGRGQSVTNNYYRSGVSVMTTFLVSGSGGFDGGCPDYTLSLPFGGNSSYPEWGASMTSARCGGGGGAGVYSTYTYLSRGQGGSANGVYGTNASIAGDYGAGGGGGTGGPNSASLRPGGNGGDIGLWFRWIYG